MVENNHSNFEMCTLKLILLVLVKVVSSRVPGCEYSESGVSLIPPYDECRHGLGIRLFKPRRAPRRAGSEGCPQPQTPHTP